MLLVIFVGAFKSISSRCDSLVVVMVVMVVMVVGEDGGGDGGDGGGKVGE